jgi:hypothetical protein
LAEPWQTEGLRWRWHESNYGSKSALTSTWLEADDDPS